MKIEIKKSKADIIMEFLCLLMLIGIALYLLICWHRIPDKIPMHYDWDGNIDRWGGKMELLILPVMTWLTDILQEFRIEAYLRVVYVIWCQLDLVVYHIPQTFLTLFAHAAVCCPAFGYVCLAALLPLFAVVEVSCKWFGHPETPSFPGNKISHQAVTPDGRICKMGGYKNLGFSSSSLKSTTFLPDMTRHFQKIFDFFSSSYPPYT